MKRAGASEALPGLRRPAPPLVLLRAGSMSCTTRKSSLQPGRLNCRRRTFWSKASPEQRDQLGRSWYEEPHVAQIFATIGMIARHLGHDFCPLGRPLPDSSAT